MPSIRIISALLLSVMLAACGGGGSLEQPGNGGGTGGGNTGGDGEYTIELTVVDQSGNAFNSDNPVTKDNQGVVQATVQQDGEPVTSGLVVFTTEFTGSVLSDTGTATIGSNGIAAVGLGSGTLKGAGKVVATLDGQTDVTASAYFYSSGDGANIEEAEAIVDVQLLVGCNENWDDNRDVARLNPTDPSSGCTVINRDISSADLGIVYVSVINASNGDGFSGLLAEVETSVGKLSPESGKAVTDSFGIALLTLQPGSVNDAGEIKATAKDVTATKAFNVGVAEFSLAIDNGLDLKADDSGDYQPLAAGATTVITVDLIDSDGTPLTLPIDVEFSSSCAQNGTAILDAKATSIAGKAMATYRSLGCQGAETDIVRAVVNGKSISTTLPLSSAEVAAIEFLGSSDSVIGLNGVGGLNLPKQSEITFKLQDKLKQPVANSRLDFKLNSYNGGVSLDQKSVRTNGEGVANVIVTSGKVPMPLRVYACYVPDELIPATYPVDDVTCWKEIYDRCEAADEANPDSVCPEGELTLVNLDAQIMSVSDLLTISSGLPDNDSFSFSTETHNVEGGQYDGEVVNLTIYMADHFNNFVPDGTSVHVRAEGGAVGTIDDEAFTPLFQCETVDGGCSVQFRTQNPRPYTEEIWGNRINSINPKTNTRNCDNFFGAPGPCLNGINRASDDPDNGVPLANRVTILATAVGEESYIDRNGNGVFDDGEFFNLYDLPEAFLDNNENGLFDGNVDCSTGVNCLPTNTDGGELEEFLAQFDDSNDNGVWDDADGMFNGLTCTEEAEAAGKCNRSLVHLRRNLEIVLSGSAGYGRFAIPNTTLDYLLELTTERGDLLENMTRIEATCESVTIERPQNGNWIFAGDAQKTSQQLLVLEPSDPDLPGYCDVGLVDISPVFIHTDDDVDPNTPHECDGAQGSYDSATGECTAEDRVQEIGIAGLFPTFYFSDLYGNPLPEGTTVTPAASNGDFVGTDPFEIGSTNTTRPIGVRVGVGREGTPNRKTTGELSVTFETPKGNKSSTALTVVDLG